MLNPMEACVPSGLLQVKVTIEGDLTNSNLGWVNAQGI